MSVSQIPAIAAQAAQMPPDLIKTEKKQRISGKVVKAIRLLVSGECRTQKAASERVGMNEGYLCTQLQKSNVRVFIAQCARENIRNGSLRASAKLIELIDADSEHVSADVAKHVLAIEGIKPANSPQVSVNIELKAGYVIDLSDKPKDVSNTALTVDHE